MMSKKPFKNRRPEPIPEWMKRWVVELVVQGVPPTKFIRENPDGTPCMEVKTKVLEIKRA